MSLKQEKGALQTGRSIRWWKTATPGNASGGKKGRIRKRERRGPVPEDVLHKTSGVADRSPGPAPEEGNSEHSTEVVARKWLPKVEELRGCGRPEQPPKTQKPQDKTPTPPKKKKHETPKTRLECRQKRGRGRGLGRQG